MQDTKNVDLPEYVKTTSLEGVLLIERPVYGDDRGDFQEVCRLPDLEKVLGYEINIRQINRSVNKPNVLRGIHVAPWGKLIYCYQGKVMQVVLDVREGSPTFGKAFSCFLGEDEERTIWLPPGFGNAFCVVSEGPAVYGYAVTSVFEAGKEFCVSWKDENVMKQIQWPLTSPIVSEKDNTSQTLKELFPNTKITI